MLSSITGTWRSCTRRRKPVISDGSQRCGGRSDPRTRCGTAAGGRSTPVRSRWRNRTGSVRRSSPASRRPSHRPAAQRTSATLGASIEVKAVPVGDDGIEPHGVPSPFVEVEANRSNELAAAGRPAVPPLRRWTPGAQFPTRSRRRRPPVCGPGLLSSVSGLDQEPPHTTGSKKSTGHLLRTELSPAGRYAAASVCAGRSSTGAHQRRTAKPTWSQSVVSAALATGTR